MVLVSEINDMVELFLLWSLLWVDLARRVELAGEDRRDLVESMESSSMVARS